MNHFSLRAEADRNDFPNLLKSIAVLVKDVRKFRDGIALIASKGGGEDEELIGNIASFSSWQHLAWHLTRLVTKSYGCSKRYLHFISLVATVRPSLVWIHSDRKSVV